MGFALAEECAARGAEVQLVCGPVHLTTTTSGIHRTDVESAQQMWDTASSLFPQMDAAILCAAVADFTPADVAEQKIKREGDDLLLRLKPTQDIAQGLGRMKQPGQRLVGFALETTDELSNARKKLQKKNLDFIVLNSLRNEGTCFQSDENQISIINADGQRDYERKSKSAVAKDIIDQLAMLL